MGKGFTIAVSGKGGVGKTVIAAHLIKRFSQQGSVLAIDADPDSNLAEALGVKVDTTISELRDKISTASPRSEIAKAKAKHFERALHEAIREFPQFDLVSMGYSEGPGCYCPHNYIIRKVIDSRASSYDFTVIDCHAGLEHLNRRTTRDVDIMLVISDPTIKALTTIKRVQELSEKLLVKFGEILVVVNKITPEAQPILERAAQQIGIRIMSYIPYDPAVAEFDILGKPITELPPNSPFSLAMDEIHHKVIQRLNAIAGTRLPSEKILQ